jgi:hypothetical protein
MLDVAEDEEGAGRSPLAVVAFGSRSAAVACSSSRSSRVAWTRHHAAAALVSASLTRASSHCRRTSVSGSEASG